MALGEGRRKIDVALLTGLVLDELHFGGKTDEKALY